MANMRKALSVYDPTTKEGPDIIFFLHTLKKKHYLNFPRSGKPERWSMSNTIELGQEGVEVRKSACYFCHQNCGVLAYVKDGKVLKIEGDPDFPTNQGGFVLPG